MKKYILTLCVAFLAGQAVSADFSGAWGYTKDVPNGVYSKYFNIKQSPNYMITGEWKEGHSDGPSGSGKVKGYVRKGGKLHLSYCSEGDNSWYTPCPKYEKDRGYFVRWNGGLVEYYRPNGGGQAYKKGDTLRRLKELEGGQMKQDGTVEVQEKVNAPEPVVQELPKVPTGQVQQMQMQMPEGGSGGDVFSGGIKAEEKGREDLSKETAKQELPETQEQGGVKTHQNGQGQVFAD